MNEKGSLHEEIEAYKRYLLKISHLKHVEDSEYHFLVQQLKKACQNAFIVHYFNVVSYLRVGNSIENCLGSILVPFMR